MSKYEQLFWNSRDIISEYFQTKARAIREFAKETSNLADKVTEAVESSK